MRLAFLVALWLVILSFSPAIAADLDVTHFGAIPDDHKDDAPALLKVINSCQGRANTNLVFKKGTYDIASGDMLVFQECKNLKITGNGSLLVFHDWNQGLALNICRNLTIDNLAIDYNPLPFCAGTVSAVNNDSIDIQLAPGYSVKGPEGIKAWMEYEPDSFIPSASGLEAYVDAKTELLPSQLWRVYVRGPFKTGMFLVLRHAVYTHQAIFVNGGNDIQFNNVTIYTAPGMGFHARCENLRLKNCGVLVRPGRHMSTAADATHFDLCRGKIRLENCVFEGMGDDGVNIHGKFIRLRKVDEHTLDSAEPAWTMPQAGESLEFVHNDLRPYATAKVDTAKVNPRDGHTLISLKEPIPTGFADGDYCHNLTRIPDEVIITGCKFRSNRARGSLIACRNVTIEKCSFENISSSAIQVECDVGDWLEAGPARNIIIRNNVISRCNYGVCARTGAIDVFADSSGGTKSAVGVHQNLTIEKNEISRIPRAGINVSAASNVIIRNNRMNDVGQAGRLPRAMGAIWLERVAKVNISDNTVTNTKPGDLVIQGEDCTEVTIK
jgi:hypothetical protein